MINLNGCELNLKTVFQELSDYNCRIDELLLWLDEREMEKVEL